MSIGIIFEHSAACTHTQNGLAKSLIKRLQLIGRPLILISNFTFFMLGTCNTSASSICIQPSSYHTYSSSQLVFGQQLDISHFKIFRCAVYVPVANPFYFFVGEQ